MNNWYVNLVYLEMSEYYRPTSNFIVSGDYLAKGEISSLGVGIWADLLHIVVL